MRATAIGAVLGAVLVLAVWASMPGPNQAAEGANHVSSAGGSELITWTAPAGENRQLLTVIDLRAKVVGVYHLDLSTGEITLKSVRNITWDLEMLEFNGTSPLPREIRSLLEQQ